MATRLDKTPKRKLAWKQVALAVALNASLEQARGSREVELPRGGGRRSGEP
jgi:hypothetical protein